MGNESISCTSSGCNSAINVSNKNSIEYLFDRLTNLFRLSMLAGDSAAQYWADVATSSEHPLAPLAHIPGVFAALWTPDTAPSTAITLGTSGFGFFRSTQTFSSLYNTIGSTRYCHSIKHQCNPNRAFWARSLYGKNRKTYESFYSKRRKNPYLFANTKWNGLDCSIPGIC